MKKLVLLYVGSVSQFRSWIEKTPQLIKIQGIRSKKQKKKNRP